MTNQQNQCKALLNHLARGHGITSILAFKMFNITSMHRRLTDLRTGRYNGIKYPINMGTWAEHNNKRFKIYKIETE